MTQSSSPSVSMPAKPVISVRPFVSSDHDQVAKLFREVMATRFSDPSDEFHAFWTGYTHKRLATDLADIPGAYMAPGGNFWVAVAANAEGERIAGIIGLERKAETEGEVRTVFVSVEHHRLGVGRALLTTLVDWAKTRGFERLFLTTLAINEQSCGFYASLGFNYQLHEPPMMMHDGLELAEFVKHL